MIPGMLLAAFGVRSPLGWGDAQTHQQPWASPSLSPRLVQRLARADACQLLLLVTLQPADTICLVFCLNASLFLKAAECGMTQGHVPPAQAEMGSPVLCDSPFFLLPERK